MANARQEGKTSYQHWNKLPIGILVHATEDYVVFLDGENEIDWKTSHAYDTAKRFPIEWGVVQSRAAALEQGISQYVTDSVRRVLARIVAEGLARGLDGDIEAATTILDKAEASIAARNREVGRLFHIQAAATTWAVIAVLCMVAWLARTSLVPILGEILFSLVLCGAAGATGALLSIFLNMITLVPDSNAARALHYAEAAIKVIAGGLGAVFAALAVRGGILFPQLSGSAHAAELLLLVSIVAGFSERLVPDLVRSVDGSEKAKPKALKP